MGLLALDEGLGADELVEVATIGNMIRSVAAARRLEKRPNLRAQQAGPVEADADGAPAERRILLLDGLHVGQDLVAADVEGAERDGPVAGRSRPPYRGPAARRRGHPLGDHELQLGAEQADADGAGLRQVRQVDEQARH